MLHKSLSKEERLRNWDVDLSSSAVRYAALDAAASLHVYNEVEHIRVLHSGLENGACVRLFDSSGTVPVANAKIVHMPETDGERHVRVQVTQVTVPGAVVRLCVPGGSRSQVSLGGLVNGAPPGEDTRLDWPIQCVRRQLARVDGVWVTTTDAGE